MGWEAKFVSLVGCNSYRFRFPPSNSIMEMLFAPRNVAVSDNRVAEVMQRWLIDQGDFYTRVEKSINTYACSQIGFNTDFNFNTSEAIGYLNQNFIADSLAGRCFYFLITAIEFQLIEQAFQCKDHLLNYLQCSPKNKLAVGCLFFLGFAAYCSSYEYADLYTYAAPMLLSMLLKNFSFAFGNYFQQIGRLSGTKDFNLYDFFSRNCQSILIRSIPFLFVLPRLPGAIKGLQFDSEMYLGKVDENEFTGLGFMSSSNLGQIIAELTIPIFGKVIFDLVYLMILKTAFKDVDLRDPIAWVFSKLKNQASSIAVSKKSKKPIKKKDKNEACNNEKKTASTQKLELPQLSPNSQSVDLSYDGTPQSKILDQITEPKKEKTKTRKVSTFKSEIQQDATPKNEVSCITIQVGNSSLTFKQTEINHLSEKNVWSVIITNSVEMQTLSKFEKTLLNGIYGKSIKAIKDGCYEIRPSSADARLEGTIYHGGVYFALQQHMSLENALEFTREFEKYVDGKVSLIVFSDEAKKHNQIGKVKQKMVKKQK